jgi:hypothetical protein
VFLVKFDGQIFAPLEEQEPVSILLWSLGSRVGAGGVMLLMAGTCPYGRSMLARSWPWRACNKNGGHWPGLLRTGPHCAGLLIRVQGSTSIGHYQT